MTRATFLVLDVDGMPQEQFDAMRETLRTIGLSHFVQHLFSHGHPDKPGVRARLVILVDRPISPSEYLAQRFGFDQVFCGGAIAARDASGKAMHQQQGCGRLAPERVRSSRSKSQQHRAGVASADALIEAAPVQVSTPRVSTSRVVGPGSFGSVERDKIASALELIDPNDYSAWMTVGACVKALEPCLGSSAQHIWRGFSDRAVIPRRPRTTRSSTVSDVRLQHCASR